MCFIKYSDSSSLNIVFVLIAWPSPVFSVKLLYICMCLAFVCYFLLWCLFWPICLFIIIPTDIFWFPVISKCHGVNIIEKE